MPKVLSKLRVDEVSCVTAGAGEGTSIVLMKRDDRKRRKVFGYAMPEPEPKPRPSIYHEIFCGKRREDTMNKAMYRDGAVTGRHLHRVQNLSRPEVKHFLLHDSAGRALRRDFPNIPFDELVDHVVEASTEKRENAVTNKRNEANNMSDHLVEVCKSVVSGDVDAAVRARARGGNQKAGERQPTAGRNVGRCVHPALHFARRRRLGAAQGNSALQARERVSGLKVVGSAGCANTRRLCQRLDVAATRPAGGDAINNGSERRSARAGCSPVAAVVIAAG